MSNAPIINRRFIKKGNSIIIKTDVSDGELKSNDVINNINHIRAKIDGLHEEIRKIEGNKAEKLQTSVNLEENLKDHMKFEKWALDIQDSKIRALVDENFDKCKAQVEAEFKGDDSMTEEQVRVTKYQRLQREIGILPNVAAEIAGAVIHDKLFNNCIFKNPWA